MNYELSDVGGASRRPSRSTTTGPASPANNNCSTHEQPGCITTTSASANDSNLADRIVHLSTTEIPLFCCRTRQLRKYLSRTYPPASYDLEASARRARFRDHVCLRCSSSSRPRASKVAQRSCDTQLEPRDQPSPLSFTGGQNVIRSFSSPCNHSEFPPSLRRTPFNQYLVRSPQSTSGLRLQYTTCLWLFTC